MIAGEGETMAHQATLAGIEPAARAACSARGCDEPAALAHTRCQGHVDRQAVHAATHEGRKVTAALESAAPELGRRGITPPLRERILAYRREATALAVALQIEGIAP